MNSPLISVIVPVYNAEQYINRCIESILNQNYPNLEIILIDDGSPDNCGRICDEFAAKDSRIKVIHQENGGVAKARNIGLKQSTGSFVCFVDSDDYIDNDYVKSLCDGIDDEIDVVISMCKIVDTNERVLDYIINPGQTTTVAVDKELNICQSEINNSVWAKLIRKDLIINYSISFPENVFLGEDAVFVADCLLNSRRIRYIPCPSYNYVQYCESLCHGKLTQKKLTYIDAWEMIYKSCTDAKKSESTAAHQLIQICLDLYRQSFIESNGYNDLNNQVYSKLISEEFKKCFLRSSGNIKYKAKYLLVTKNRLVYDGVLRLKYKRLLRDYCNEK